MVVDTTVFVDLFRQDVKASKFLLNTKESLILSRVVLMELLRGLKSKREIKIMAKQLKALGIEVLEINENISMIAGDLFEKYYHSYGLGIMDALVAASAIVTKDTLISHNIKHFTFIKELKLVKPY